MPNSCAIVTPPLPAANAVKLASLTAKTQEADIASLTRRMARGEDDAFREFHARYFDRLYRLLLVLTRGAETEAQDALQETLCRVARYVRHFDDEEIFWCWLTALARSAVRDAGRKQHRYYTLLQNYLRQWLPVQAHSQPNFDQQLEELLLGCVNQLEAKERALVEGKYLQHMSVRELAERNGLTEKAVESRLLRLRQRLRERLLHKLKEQES